MVTPSQQSYLKSLLSQRGPDELPYPDDLKQLIEQHLLTLTCHFPRLIIRSDPFFDIDGSRRQLLHVHGTIPITFRGSSYNIPITIWLVESYPVASPRVFLSPTHDMVIKRHHRYVEYGTGTVCNFPYLDNWAYPRSNLTDLARSLSRTFGLDPPLFSKAASRSSLSSLSSSSSLPSSTSNSNNRPLTSSSSSRSNSLSSSSSWSSSSEYDSDKKSIDPSEVFQQNATRTLSARLKLGLEEQQRMHDIGMKKLAAIESQLKSRRKKIMLAVEQQQQERDALEQKLQFMHTNTDMIELWLMNHRNLQAAEVDIDDAIVPCAGLSKQMLDSSAEDLALEDVLYSLDKAVQQGCIPMDVYLRHVRTVAREQFLHRAMSMKVETSQRQMKISNMAAR